MKKGHQYDRQNTEPLEGIGQQQSRFLNAQGTYGGTYYYDQREILEKIFKCLFKLFLQLGV